MLHWCKGCEKLKFHETLFFMSFFALGQYLGSLKVLLEQVMSRSQQHQHQLDEFKVQWLGERVDDYSGWGQHFATAPLQLRGKGLEFPWVGCIWNDAYKVHQDVRQRARLAQIIISGLMMVSSTMIKPYWAGDSWFWLTPAQFSRLSPQVALQLLGFSLETG